MDKTVYAGTSLIALALLAGSFFIPSSFVMVLASTSLVANVARIVVVLLMIGLIVTNPPRSRGFRATLAAASVGFLYYALAHALSGTIQIADSVLYLVAAISFAIEALESRIPLIDDEETEEVEVPVRLASAAARGL
jgi:hypothetical protein